MGTTPNPGAEFLNQGDEQQLVGVDCHSHLGWQVVLHDCPNVQAYLHGDLYWVNPKHTAVNNGNVGTLIHGEACCHSYMEAHNSELVRTNHFGIGKLMAEEAVWEVCLVIQWVIAPQIICLADTRVVMDGFPVWASPTVLGLLMLYFRCGCEFIRQKW